MRLIYARDYALCLSDASKDPQSTHPTIRENIKSHMGRYAGVHHFVEEMARVRLQLRARQYGPPYKLRILQSF